MTYQTILNIINYILNLFVKYIESKSLAYDERIKDSRDNEISGEIIKYYKIDEFQTKFRKTDNKSISQFRDGFKMSCTAQATANAINTAKFYLNDKETVLGDDLWLFMKLEGLATDKYGAYGIDAIKSAKLLGWIKSYYSVHTVEQIMNAIYNNNIVVTGSSKINWRDSKDGLVRKIDTGYAHFFSIVGWDKDKVIGEHKGALLCENSGGIEYQDKGHFYIPFDLIDKGILFNTKKALVI